MRYLITLSYDGTNYKGYQTQPGPGGLSRDRAGVEVRDVS